jgi:hypothetical protein
MSHSKPIQNLKAATPEKAVGARSGELLHTKNISKRTAGEKPKEVPK